MKCVWYIRNWNYLLQTELFGKQWFGFKIKQVTSFEMDFRGKCDWINILYMSTPPVFYLTSSTNIEQFFWQESGLNWMFIIRKCKEM